MKNKTKKFGTSIVLILLIIVSIFNNLGYAQTSDNNDINSTPGILPQIDLVIIPESIEIIKGEYKNLPIKHVLL